MGRQLLNSNQVKGVYNPTLRDDVIDVADKSRTYDRPVATIEKLPLEGNQDGDVRLVLDENRFYIWDEPTSLWVSDIDQFTEARTHQVLIPHDGETNFQINIKVGIPDGIASLKTIVLTLNGVTQNHGVDYSLGISGPTSPNLIIDWISSDFNLEMDDVMLINYDKLILR